MDKFEQFISSRCWDFRRLSGAVNRVTIHDFGPCVIGTCINKSLMPRVIIYCPDDRSDPDEPKKGKNDIKTFDRTCKLQGGDSFTIRVQLTKYPEVFLGWFHEYFDKEPDYPAIHDPDGFQKLIPAPVRFWKKLSGYKKWIHRSTGWIVRPTDWSLDCTIDNKVPEVDDIVDCVALAMGTLVSRTQVNYTYQRGSNYNCEDELTIRAMLDLERDLIDHGIKFDLPPYWYRELANVINWLLCPVVQDDRPDLLDF